jgi:Putative Na+/H+ antiporter
MLPLEYSPTLDNGLWGSLVSRATAEPFNLFTLLIFLGAILHTFYAHRFAQLSNAIKERRGEFSPLAEMLAFLGEVEVIFGLWVIPLIIGITIHFDYQTAVEYLEGRNYREPLLVIVIMTLASTRPIIQCAQTILSSLAGIWGRSVTAWWFVLLTVGPLLGSLITEPGAMTVTAILLGQQFFQRRPSPRLAYATLGLLFVNVSVGGVLDHFAAPPVLIVADRWELTSNYMLTHFGWKAVVGILTANTLYWSIFRRELKELDSRPATEGGKWGRVPVWVMLVHIFFIAAVVLTNHDPIVFIGIFLIFLGFYQATTPHQRRLSLRHPLLVGLFLAGLVIHGGLQGWWISPILSRFTQLPLMAVATVLTAFNDNAAITYLSSLTPDFGPVLRYAVIAGAITGGGLTIIANGPNPAGQQILSRHFPNGISPLGLFLGALVPTIIMGLAFILLGMGDMFP